MVKLIHHSYVHMVVDSEQGAVLFASLDSEKAFITMNSRQRNGNTNVRIVSAPMNIDIYKVIS